MITICLTEEEILNLPNDGELGEVVRRKLWKEKTNNIKNENSKESEDERN